MGRNKLKPEEKRVNMLITVSQETRDKLRKHPKPAGRVIEELLSKEWISVEDRLPEASTIGGINIGPNETDVVLIIDDLDQRDCAFYCYEMKEWFITQGSETILDVTHWMPLPESPKR
ncbi:MAG: DUF551 domain-containing protein [Methylococcaceae bacterium]